MNAVIIATRNRFDLWVDLVSSLSNIDEIDEIIVVDSSDNSIPYTPKLKEKHFVYIHTNIASAAIQRNIGIDKLNDSTQYLFFLDDDTRPVPDYFQKLIFNLKNEGVSGVSGIALSHNQQRDSLRQRPSGLKGIYQRIFLLDSKRDGTVTKGGINIPVRDYDGLPVEVDWLIACSGWNYQRIKGIRFEADFMGAAIGEDVVFSIRASSTGKLITDPRIVLDHLESNLNRPTTSEFWEMWFVNRKRIVNVMQAGLKGEIAFWWSTLGQITIFIIGIIKGKFENLMAVKGIFNGIYQIIGKKFEN